MQGLNFHEYLKLIKQISQFIKAFANLFLIKGTFVINNKIISKSRENGKKLSPGF